MFYKIKKRVEQELKGYFLSIDKNYSLSRLSPVLFRNIEEFILRKGKRIRPALFVVGYLGYAKKAPAGLYRSALSWELLHDFLLVHDDIIDKSDLRRGKPSMHAMLNRYLSGRKGLKFSGEDLTIVAGDVMYALALDAFLAVKEDMRRKEKALKKLIRAALLTGTGEFIELLSGLKSLDEIGKEDIYRIYDYKTANYTFASPLSMGATLAGAPQADCRRLFDFGLCLGRAFQIKDDYLGLFAKESEIGKSVLTDLQEAKKTILIWYAYKNTGRKDRLVIKSILAKNKVGKTDLGRIRRVVRDCGGVRFAERQIKDLLQKAKTLNKRLLMRSPYKQALVSYAEELLKL
ncbi:MAG: polyprenyl synthetase family protein [Candidatus Omnitrophica bacterium]|nr:polyprenyl synthetase family protein [Candidatus Omnitrophota bacterium]